MERSSTSHRSTKEPMCGHCYEKFAGMIEPRKLPCAHVFCLPCIMEDMERREVLRCPTCKRDHSNINVDSLPRVVKVAAPKPKVLLESLEEVEDEDDVDLPVSFMCQVCKDRDVDAVSYCVDCGKKMCDKHMKFHDEYQLTFSNQSHNKISIEKYKLSPHKYIIRRCQNHPGRALIRACLSCSRTFCEKCDIKGKCPKEGTTHIIRALADVGTKFKDKLNGHVNCLSERLADAELLQEKTTADLIQIKETVFHMCDEVDRVTNEQVSVINRRAEMLKIEIQSYQQESMKQVESFTNHLAGKKAAIDDLSKDIQDLLTTCHDVDIIKEYRQKVKDVEDALNIEFGHCQLPYKRMLIRTGDFKDIELELRDSIPSILRFRGKERKPTNICSTVSWTTDSTLLCGRYESLEVRHSSTVEIINSLKTSSVNGVTLHRQGFLALFWKDGKDYIILYSPQLEFLKLFGEFFRTSDKFSHISASDKLVAAVDPDHRVLKVFSYSGQFLYDVKLLGIMRPWGVHFLPDGCVLVTDFLAGCLKKYVVKPGNSEPVWVCRDLLSPVGISTNTNGLIFVASFNAKKIYVISQQGILLKELTNQRLLHVKEIYDITVNDDQVALACGNDGVVSFKLMYDAMVM